MNTRTERPEGSNHTESMPQGPACTHWSRVALRAVERMCTTRINAQLGLVGDITVSVVLLYAGLREGGLSLPGMLVSVGAGLLAFSFFEYAMHRWLFHGPAQVFQQGHLVHHQHPRGFDSLPFFLVPLTILLLASVLNWVLPTVAFLFAGSFAAGYAAYGTSHWVMHAFRFSNPLLRRWAADHHIHHFHADKNFGVTSPLWDIVLHTRYVSARRSAAPSRSADRAVDRT
ncbi:MAG: sterol desaturase family protein [Dokdonella sp.]